MMIQQWRHASNANAVFDRYTVETTRTFNDSGETTGTFVTANLQDGKFFSETVENFVNGVSQGQLTQQRYFYENGLLAKRSYENDIREFFYDAQGRLIAIDWAYDLRHLYYRFNYVSDSEVYFERSDVPYGAPDANLSRRIILNFDENANVIKAGADNDEDGVINDPHTFDYDGNNDLIAIHHSNGTTTPVAYSGIRDNFFKLNLNTMGGKKNLMIYQGECYAYLLPDFRLSPHLRLADSQQALYEVQSDQQSYFFKKTETTADENVTATVVTTFYFR